MDYARNAVNYCHLTYGEIETQRVECTCLGGMVAELGFTLEAIFLGPALAPGLCQHLGNGSHGSVPKALCLTLESSFYGSSLLIADI